eukprot:GHVU01096293.1.p1 GENE.GHVU01096293.1~~GHVU01096293.1.p1  ORF type:complete len:220 (-),score=33.44 GHVU01096293.1:1487-2146(-)
MRASSSPDKMALDGVSGALWHLLADTLLGDDDNGGASFGINHITCAHGSELVAAVYAGARRGIPSLAPVASSHLPGGPPWKHRDATREPPESEGDKTEPKRVQVTGSHPHVADMPPLAAAAPPPPCGALGDFPDPLAHAYRYRARLEGRADAPDERMRVGKLVAGAMKEPTTNSPHNPFEDLHPGARDACCVGTILALQLLAADVLRAKVEEEGGVPAE